VEQTDRRTDGRTPCRFIDPAPHTMRTAVIIMMAVNKLANNTRSSAIAEGPRDASCQLKSCQLPYNSAETTCSTSPEQIEVMNLEG